MHYSKQGLFHLDNVPFSQFPPGGDPHVITVQLHHGCRDKQGMCVCDGVYLAGPALQSQASLGPLP